MQALQAQNGLGNQSNVFNQLQGVANGTGPNPAQAMLNQSTGTNVANQAALMAGQRGANQNVGLLARQIGQQGAGIQQQAAGQGATLQAQQGLGALNQMGGIAGQQAQQQAAGTLGYNQAAQQEQQNLLNSIANQNNANVSMQGNINNANAGIQGINAQTQGAVLGQTLGSIGSVLGLAQGGEVPQKVQHFAGGGMPESFVGNWLNGGVGVQPIQQMGGPNIPAYNMSAFQAPKPQAAVDPYASINKAVAPDSMGTIATTAGGPMDNAPDPFQPLSMTAAHGGMAPKSMKQGGGVGGKAKVSGDSQQNDTVSAKLSPGEIVIPRSITQHPNAPQLAAQFVMKTLAEHKQNYASGGPVSLAGDPNADQSAPGSIVNGQWVAPVGAPTDSMTGGSSGAPNAIVPRQAPKDNSTPQQIAQESDTNKAQMQQTQDPYGYGAMNKALMGGIGEEKAGMAGYGKAVGEEGAAADQAIQKTQDQQAELMQQYQKHYDDLNLKRQQFTNDIANSKIDPNRFLSSMGTGKKIATGLGLILGGIGAGFAHTQNQAMGYLNDQINRDIDAQKAELGKKQNLLSANLQDFGNLDQATTMTRIMMNDALSTNMKQLAARYQGKIESARMLQGIGQLDRETAGMHQQLAMQRSMSSSGGGGLPFELDPARDRRVVVGNQPFHAASAQAAEKYSPQIDALDELDNVLSRIDDFNQKIGTTGFGTSNAGQAATLNQEVTDAFARAEDEGKLPARIINTFKESAPKAGAILTQNQAGKIKGLRSLVSSHRNTILKNLSSGPAFGK